MAIIDYSSGPRVVNERPHTVYTKPNWAASWTVQPNLSCYECLWTSAPNNNTARLRWEIGNVILPGNTTPTVFTPWMGRGQFVRIDWLMDDNVSILRWVGFIDSSSWPVEAFGHQEIVAYGLERALGLTPITESVWWDETDDEPRRTGLALPFNGYDGLRSDTVHGANDVYYFRDPRPAIGPTETTQPWSTRQIVKYLLHEHLPTNTLGIAAIPWTIEGLEQLPDWDQPRLETENRTVWDLLTELCSPEKLLGMTVGSDGSTAVYVRFFTHLAADLTIEGNTLLANPNQHSVIFAPDALTNAQISDVGGGYDQVVCRGARRQVVCTLKTYGTNAPLTRAWTDEQQDDYQIAASFDVGYSGLSDDDKRKANSRKRRDNSLHNVHRVLRLHPAWNYTIGSALFGLDNPDPGSVRILGRVPIKKGSDWSGTIDPDHFDRDGEGLPMLLTWTDPDVGTDATKRIATAALGQLKAEAKTPRGFSVQPRARDRELHVEVTGADQHVIAAAFTKLPVDDTDKFLNILETEFTATLEEDRHVEASYPATAPSADVVRRLVVDAGPEYQRVAIHANTVASIEPITFEAKLATGGVLVDDTDKLKALARFIYDSVARSRQTASWSSQRKIATIAVGDLITVAGGATINAPITAISIRGGVSIGRPAPATTQSFEVYRGTQDPLRVLQQFKAGRKQK